jgi:hypothetical protein
VSEILHTVLLGDILRCSIAFFDVTLVGLALNHHSKDVSVGIVVSVMLK